MAAQVEDNYKVLKAKIGHVDLRELLRAHFARLLEETINPTELALILFKKDVLSMKKLKKCMDESMNFYQNLDVYQTVKRKNAGEALIEALEQTENFQILQLLQSDLGQLLEKPEDATKSAVVLFKKNDTFGEKARNKQLSLSCKVVSSVPIQNNRLTPVIKTNTQIAQEAAKFLPPKKESSSVSAAPVKQKPTRKQVSILNSVSSTEKSPNFRHCRWGSTETIGVENLSRIGEDNLDFTLVRVATTCGTAESRHCFNSADIFHSQEKIAITKFLEAQLDLDLDKETMGRRPREIYVNTRSFGWRTWEWFSKMLYNFCRESLEHLWLDEVDYREFCAGTEWMQILNMDEPRLRFHNLKVFIFQGSQYNFNAQTFYRMLALIKPINFSLDDLWNKSGCQLQIWKKSFETDSCSILVDPARATLFLLDGNETLQADIDRVLKGESKTFQFSTFKKEAPIVKLFYSALQINLFKSPMNLQTLTHLCINSKFYSCEGFVNFVNKELSKVLDNLSQFKLLQKLMLLGAGKWDMNLKKLEVLNNLSFLYLASAKVNEYSSKVGSYPWRKSVQTVIFKNCVFIPPFQTAKTVSTSTSVKLERNQHQNVEGSSSQFKKTEFLDSIKIMGEFFN